MKIVDSHTMYKSISCKPHWLRDVRDIEWCIERLHVTFVLLSTARAQVKVNIFTFMFRLYLYITIQKINTCVAFSLGIYRLVQLNIL
jgi:hypothetical protein